MNLKENWEKKDIISFSIFNNIVTTLKTVCENLKVTNNLKNNYILGDYIYTDELQEIEDILFSISSSFQRKVRHNLSVFDYMDINRYCKTINNIYNELAVSKMMITENENYLTDENNNILCTEVIL